MRGIAHWSAGHGDCGENQGVGYAGNGTGYIADFRINALFVIEAQSATFHFIGYNGKEFFGPLTGPIDGDGNFLAKNRNDKYDEDYEFKGKLGGDSMVGTFTRRAHYLGEGNSGPRCTATWTVTFKEGPWAPTKPSASPHPATMSKPPVAIARPGTPLPEAAPKPPEGGTSSPGGLGLWIAAGVAAAIAALIAIVRQTKNRPKPECRCVMTAKVTGPTQIHVPQCAKPKKWIMKAEESQRATLEVGDETPRHYSVEVNTSCTGGGKIELRQIFWSADYKDDHHLAVTAVVEGVRRCPGEPDDILSAVQSLEVAIALMPCCGPDITEGYIAAINRIYHKLAKDLPLSSTVFMARWGSRMIYRPYGHGVFFEDKCPSERCNDTVTMLGKCYDCFVGDNLLFGIVAGFLKISLLTLEAGGWLAKVVKQPGLVVHATSEELWRKGLEIGTQARERLEKHQAYDFDRTILAKALQGVPERETCRPCKAKGPESAFIDFSREPW